LADRRFPFPPTQAALRASRRLNDYSTAVRIFEGVREKVENKNQYNQYLEALAPLRKELGTSHITLCRAVSNTSMAGIETKDELYPSS
jgi:hypothetical protein